jgi:hypothetical protein
MGRESRGDGVLIGTLKSSAARRNRTRVLREGNVSNRVFYSAVVLDFISNPAEDLEETRSDDEDQTYRESLRDGANRVANPQFVDRMPRNSIIGQVVSDNGKEGMPEIFYPFFSPHMSPPVKAGEQIWVFFERAGDKDSLGYWMTRRATDLQVDDLNYTHQDRASDPAVVKTSQSLKSSHSGESIDEEANAYGFPSGGGFSKQDNTLLGDTPYEGVISLSHTYQHQFTGEPVPRFSKRSADFTIQGSNNTLICLGEDRGRNSDGEGGGTAADRAITGKGAIDIVTGRGVSINADDGSLQYEDETSPPIVENTREYEETDKTPAIKSEADNLLEGDPDFINDLSRVYVTMKSNGDVNFGISELESAGDTDVSDRSEEPFVIAKSTNTRIIAKGDGSIKIVKMLDSDANSDDNTTGNEASIVIDKDGNIQVRTGGKVEIAGVSDSFSDSTGTASNGTADQPYLRWDEFAAWGDALIDAVTDAIQNNATAIQVNGAALSAAAAAGSGGGQTPGWNAPNVPLGTAFATLNSNSATQGGEISSPLATIDTYKSGQGTTSAGYMDKIRSKIIFGE